MDNTQSALIAVLVLAVAIVVGCYFVGMDDTDNNESELEGYWYQIEYEGYKNCEYVGNDGETSDGFGYNIKIDECKDGVFTGVYHNSAITGTYVNGILNTNGVQNGTSTWMYGTMSDGFIYIASTEKTGTSNNSMFTIYSKDPLAQPKDISTIDIRGEWTSYSKHYLNNDANEQLLGDTLTITEQKGAVFKGTMEQTVNNEVVDLELSGVLSLDKSGSYTIGYIYCNKETWTVAVKENDLTLHTTMINDTGLSDPISIAVNRSYSHDGSPVDYDYADLKGTTWVVRDSQIAFKNDTYGETYIADGIYLADESYVLIITEQDGSLIAGSAISFGIKVDMVGHLYGSDRIFINGTYASGDIVGVGTINNDTLTINESYDSVTHTSQSTVFAKYSGSDMPTYEGDITGHWYQSLSYDPVLDDYYYTYGGDVNGVNLDILSKDGVLILGNYDGTPIAGMFVNNMLRFSVENSEGTKINFECTINSRGFMSGLITYGYSDGSESLKYVSFSKEDRVCSTPNYSEYLDGTWSSASSIIYNGTVIDNGQRTLTIDTDGGTVSGTMQLANNMAEVNGVVKSMRDSATMLLTTGSEVFYLYYADETLYQYYMIADNGTAVVVHKEYTKDGATPAVQTYPDVEDTKWTTTETTMLSSSGQRSEPRQLHIEIDDQEGSMISGTYVIGYGTDTPATSAFVGYFIPGDDNACKIILGDRPNDVINLKFIDGKIRASITMASDGSDIILATFEQTD